MRTVQMAAFSPEPASRYHVRSISLPPRSHPHILRVQEHLNKLKTWEVSSSSSSLKAEEICTGLSGLGDLYKFIDGLLHLPLTQQALSQHQHQQWVNELLDESVRHLDICSNTRDSILKMKESVRELQSALRRRKAGEFTIETDINAYICSRKKMKEEITKSIAALKQMDNKNCACPPLFNRDDNLSAMVRVLREASWITSSMFRSLLGFLSVPAALKPKPSRWLLVSKLVHRGLVACEGQQKNTNELESVDNAIRSILGHDFGVENEIEKIQSALERLKDLDVSIEGLENGLECFFRRLIQTGVCLLNLLSY